MARGLILKKAAAAGMLVFAVLFFLSLASARAQTASPQFFVTWKAIGSYAPSSYEGKVLPTYGSKITAAFELVSGGKVLNLKGQTIYWYLNDVLLGGGSGVQQMTLPTFGVPPNALTLKIELPSYNGNLLLHTVSISTVVPQVVVYAPYPNGQFSQNPVVVTAIPYFFNTTSSDNLSYQWSVNGQLGSSAENPSEADVALPSSTPAGTNFGLSATVQNPRDSTLAIGSANLIYQPQLQ